MDSKERFSNRVEDYVKYRPGYPVELVDFLQLHYYLPIDTCIADIGAGTGISSELFLRKGFHVIAVEPNKQMREKSLELLSKYDYFNVVAGSAESTGLDGDCIDLIVAGQAFHWFDRTKCKNEFLRILKSSGVLALIWNERLTTSAFEIAYDELIKKYATDYLAVDHRNIDLSAINDFYSPSICRLDSFENQQVFDFEGLKGRLLSSSYIPVEHERGYDAMLLELKTLFDRYQVNDRVIIEYETKVYSGILS